MRRFVGLLVGEGKQRFYFIFSLLISQLMLETLKSKGGAQLIIARPHLNNTYNTPGLTTVHLTLHTTVPEYLGTYMPLQVRHLVWGAWGRSDHEVWGMGNYG